jgi:glycosyltransferase involved in cell wall biosynthesis
MKILVVCQYYYPEPFRITDICKTLVQRGHDVTVLTGIPNYPEGRIFYDYCHGKNRSEKIDGVKVIRNFEIGRRNGHLTLFLNYLSYVISASIRALLIKEEFDVVFVNQLSPVMMAIPAILYKNKHKKKMILYCLDLWPDSLAAGGVRQGSLIYNIFLKISKSIYNSADMIFIASSMFKEYFEKNLGIRKDKMEHLPQYAEDLFTQKNDMKTNNGKFDFIFAGNIGDIQSVETIIRAANELRDYPLIAFHIIGEGSKLNECRQLSDSLNLKSVVFYGRKPVNEMPHYYEMADAMLVTLKNDKVLSNTLPGKVQSYLAAGKPIIGSINGETSIVIEKSGCGFCCKAEDYISYADMILKYCNSDRKDEMANNARQYYFENYSKDQFISKLESALFSQEN